MTGISYRAASPDDTEAIQTCIARAYAAALRDIADLPDVTSGVREDIAANTVTVAEEVKRILGVVIFGETPDAVMIFNLAVIPEAQGRGVARQLLDVAEASARGSSHSFLRLRTHKLMEDTRSIYGHLGWSEVQVSGNTVLLEKSVASPVT
ncbi:MAG: GNAT family N-acetyltransferase [Ruegeria sp.]